MTTRRTWRRRTWRRLRYPPGLHPWRWRFLTVWLVLFTSLTGWAFNVQGHLITDGRQAHDSLCALRLNLQLQIGASDKYLDDLLHHRRLPVAGITRNDIKAGIARAELTLRSLEALHCHRGKAVAHHHTVTGPVATVTTGDGGPEPTTTTTGGTP